MFSKSLMILSIMTLFSMIMILSMESNVLINIMFFELFKGNLDPFCLSFMMEYSSMTFVFMTSMVTMFVCSFSQVYLEWYENKKYMMLMFLFYMAMIILTFSSSPLTLLLGWDYLGITSVFLIMFYPNENNMNNSIWTMIFNRMGDVFLMIVFCMIIMESNMLLNLSSDPIVLVFFSLCAFTKSAQFPFSTWLPMAMSAPTPISAMVHSSTLVTAGIFLLEKVIHYMLIYFIADIILLVSSISMISGGFLSCFETDFKKVIAFSTMSQISMMIMFLGLGMKMICMIHMIFHALFKSLLFSSSGMIFFMVLMDQKKINMSYKNYANMNNIMIMLSVFSMTGLTMSLSFFSKDYLLEWFISQMGSTEVFVLLILSSVLTLGYSNNLLSSSINKFISSKFNYMKELSISFFLYSLVMMSMVILYKMSVSNVNLALMDLLSLNLLFLLMILFSFNKVKKVKYFIQLLCLKLIYFKILLDLFILMYKMWVSELISSDKFFFKSFYLNLLLGEMKLNSKFAMLKVILMLLLWSVMVFFW